jgi:type VI secretion system protein VasG
VLLDEIEKAHPDVMELFYQVFDKGRMEDAEGREIDFRNTVILLTSNSGSEQIWRACSQPGELPEMEELKAAVMPELQRVFKPALLGRLTVVPYYPISDAALLRIIELKLGRVGERLRESQRIDFHYTPAVVDAIAARCREVESGARNVDHILSENVLPEISRSLLAGIAEGEPARAVRLDISATGEFLFYLDR